GVGSSGREIYALDITDPENFSEDKANELVIGNWDEDTMDDVGEHLGNTVGTPIIERMHSGEWAFIFGNGLDSDETGGVYIGLIDPDDGEVSFEFLGTDKAAGIVNVTSVDLDGDHIADYLYAGDTSGNVWRFDVTSDEPKDWQAGSKPLFEAKDGANNTQPITTAIIVLAVEDGPATRVMLYFGTGRE